MKLSDLTISQVRNMLNNRIISVRELTEQFLKCIDQKDKLIHAFITITAEEALKKAEDLDRRLNRKEKLPPLAGIPMALKDNLSTEEIRTTCGSRMLKNYIPPYNAFVVKKLNDQGCILLGKTNLDEFAIGSSTETSYFGSTYNPRDLERVPGGSSGGSAAAVAAGEALFALGSDTGGSIRLPAAYCGVVGLKPTYGRVSRYGLIAFASSLDQVGPLTTNVADSAEVLNCIAGHDPCDSTSLPIKDEDFTRFLGKEIKGIKIGLPEELLQFEITPGVRDNIEMAIKILEEAGAEVLNISLPYIKYAFPAYYIIASAEASSNLARFDGIQYGYQAEEAIELQELYCQTRTQGFGAGVKRRIILGTYILNSDCYDTYYRQAQKARTLINQDFNRAFEEVDIIIAPTTNSVAFKAKELINNMLEMCLIDKFTLPANLAGLPAISVPFGEDKGLPIGIQLITRAFEEAELLQTAYIVEQANPANYKGVTVNE